MVEKVTQKDEDGDFSLLAWPDRRPPLVAEPVCVAFVCSGLTHIVRV